MTPPEGFVLEGEVKPPPGFVIDDSQRGPASDAAVARTAGNLGRKARDSAASVLQQRDEGIDYSGVPDKAVQAKYSLLSKPEDRTNYLKTVYGKENVTKDSYGADVVIQPDGTRKAFVAKVYGDEQPASVGAQWSGLAGEALPTAGIITGGVVGAPLGPVGGATFAAAGGGAGVAANKLVARALGLPMTEDSTETAKSIVTEGMVPGALGEGFTRGLAFIGRTLLGPWQPGSMFGPWSRNEPRWREQMAEAQAARDFGLRPRMGAAQPNATLTGRAQAMSNRIFGDELPQINRPVLEQNIGRLTEEASGRATGLSPINPETLNANIAAKASQAQAAAEAAATQARADAERALADAQKRLTQDVGAPKGDLAVKAEADIRGAREAFGKKSSELYAPIDALAGQPLVPTAGLKAQLAAAMEGNPLMKPGEVFAKQINDLPEKVTFQQMQAIRSTLYSEADFAALNSGLPNRARIQLAKAANDAFEEAGKGFTTTKTLTVRGPDGEPIQRTINVPANAEAQAAVQALRRADQFYKAGVKRFDDMTSQALVKDATKSGFIEPEKVAQFIATPGQTDKLLRIKKVVSPETFAEVGKQTWSNTLRDAADPLTGEVSGRRLAARLDAYSKNGMLEALYGENAPKMRQFAQQLAALDGKIPADALASGDIKTAIQKAVGKQQELDDLMSKTWMKAVKSDGPKSLQAAEWLTKPDNRLELRSAIKQLGPQSEEAKALREYLARKIFSTMEQEATRGAEKYAKTELMGEPLVRELQRYGKPYLEEVFGKEWTDKAFSFAKAAEVGTRKNPTDAGGIVGSAIAIRPLHYVGTLAGLFAKGELFATPAFIDYAMKGFMRGGTGEFLRDMSMLGTRTFAAQAAVDKTKASAEYGRGVATKAKALAQ